MRLGIDLGGIKIEIIALDKQGNEILRLRIPTPQGSYQAAQGDMQCEHSMQMYEHRLARGQLKNRFGDSIGVRGAAWL